MVVPQITVVTTAFVAAVGGPSLLDKPFGIALVVGHAYGVGQAVEYHGMGQGCHAGANVLIARGMLDHEQGIAIRGIEMGGSVEVEVDGFGRVRRRRGLVEDDAIEEQLSPARGGLSPGTSADGDDRVVSAHVDLTGLDAGKRRGDLLPGLTFLLLPPEGVGAGRQRMISRLFSGQHAVVCGGDVVARQVLVGELDEFAAVVLGSLERHRRCEAR